MLARRTAASELLAGATSAESPAEAIGRAVLILTDAQRAAVFFRSPNGLVTCPWSHNLSEAYVGEMITRQDDNPWAHILRYPELSCMDLPKGRRPGSPQPWLLPNVAELPASSVALATRARQEGVSAICSWPLTRAGRVIGAIVYYYDQPHICSVPELDALRWYTVQAAAVLERRTASHPGAQIEGDDDGPRASGAEFSPVEVQPEPDGPLVSRTDPKSAGPWTSHARTESIQPRDPLPALARDEETRQKEATETSGAFETASRRLELQLGEVQRLLAAEAAHLAGERRGLEAQLAELKAAQAALAGEQTRLAERQNELRGETDRLSALQRDVASGQAQVAQERAALDTESRLLADGQKALADGQKALAAEQKALAAEQRALAAEQTALAVENERLAEAQGEVREAAQRSADTQRELAAEADRLAEAGRSLEADRTRLSETQAELTVSEDALGRDRRRLEEETARIADARKELEAAQTAAETAARTETAAETRPRRFTVARRGKKAEHVRPADNDAGAEADVDPEVDPRNQDPQGADTAAEPAAEAGETTYAMLLDRAGAQNVRECDEQIAAVATMLDRRAGRTAGYSKRLAGWAEGLARSLSCPDEEILAIRRATLLYDIGTVDVPETTLRKAGGLTPDEQAMLEQQPIIAHGMLKDVDGMRGVAAVLRHRFEQWGGKGYPDRLKENAIPLGARILAIVEAYGEMITGRPGVPKLYISDTIAALKRGSGTRFDPKLTATFCQTIARG